ncbi:MAG: purine-nucleoside phosphorylase [Actinomycetota bacterium]|nr:purine-nucleoside phosphorylase [Actinomycetota bacterium]
MTGPISDAIGFTPRVAIVLGSGLSALAKSLVGGRPRPYGEIEGLTTSAIEGHEGALYAGEVSGVPVAAFAGRVHMYEGHSARVTTHAIQQVVEEGCGIVILTNAAGGIDPDLEVGAPCLISDHLNLTGTNPLIGPHDGRGPRFLDLSEVYDKKLRSLAHAVDGDLKEGVYAGLMGPTYETPAEVRMLRALGASLVGMSTVLEAISARYLGARVLGISVVTNLAAGISPAPLSHDEVAEAGRKAQARLERLLAGVLAGLN